MTKICTKEGCRHEGKPQSLDNFPIRKDRNNTPISWCFDCKREYDRQRVWSKRHPFSCRIQDCNLLLEIHD